LIISSVIQKPQNVWSKLWNLWLCIASFEVNKVSVIRENYKNTKFNQNGKRMIKWK